MSQTSHAKEFELFNVFAEKLEIILIHLNVQVIDLEDFGYDIPHILFVFFTLLDVNLLELQEVLCR